MKLKKGEPRHDISTTFYGAEAVIIREIQKTMGTEEFDKRVKKILRENLFRPKRKRDV
jgi:aminopeptidase N